VHGSWQSAKVLASDFVKLRTDMYTGGVAPKNQAFDMAALDAVFGTPGRLQDVTSRGFLDIKLFTHVVLREFDGCLEYGFDPQLLELLSKTNCAQVCALYSSELLTMRNLLKQFAPMRIVEPCLAGRAPPSWYVAVQEERWKVRERGNSRAIF
jgi:superfamily II DNA/RNA helicase